MPPLPPTVLHFHGPRPVMPAYLPVPPEITLVPSSYPLGRPSLPVNSVKMRWPSASPTEQGPTFDPGPLMLQNATTDSCAPRCRRPAPLSLKLVPTAVPWPSTCPSATVIGSAVIFHPVCQLMLPDLGRSCPWTGPQTAA